MENPQTKTVEYENAGDKVRLVLKSATALIGMKRSVLTGRGIAYLKNLMLSDNGDGEDGDEPKPMPTGIDAQAVGLVARVLYPDLLACVIEVDGLELAEMTVEDFANLPDALVGAWEQACYELNPHWLGTGEPTDEEEKEAEKKGETPTNSGSDEN